MALTITSREYAAGSAGFASLVADLKTMADWTEIDETTVSGTTTFKKYNDAAGAQYVAIQVTQNSNYPPGIHVRTVEGDNSYESGFTPTSAVNYKYVNFVQWEGGFYAHCCGTAMPSTAATYIGFGLGFGDSMVRQSSKWCAWYGVDSKWHIASPGTTTSGNITLATLYKGKFSVAHPLAVTNSEYIPNTLLYLRQVTEDNVNTCGWCTWNGKRYYKNGCMLIPEEV